MCEIKDNPTTPPSFVDLTPVDNANIEGSYEDALNSALENDNVKNIALTGPYGSGKSSIIKTFEKKYKKKYKFLNISLASFKDVNDDIENIQIERSILQQMLYGADASKLPFSRFKRIATPKKALIKATLLMFAMIIPFILYNYKGELLSAEYWTLDWWVGTGLVTYTLIILVIIIANVYKSSFGLSLKKFSLKNMEIEQGDISENSILNRHLDEIIYFFQQTEYNVVVIEDLDRFGSPEIFVKLREINKLINDNEKTSGKVKFLYALKDGMFAHKSRAKFFDFIIPVVPVINSSNSLDKMQERIKGSDFSKKISSQFLREVSIYIDDLRLIHNIFNEFTVYSDRLKTDKLSLTKLLAMMVYKNVYPNDFEDLHHGKGALYDICKKKPEYIQEAKTKIQEEISGLKKQIELAKSEPARNIRELTDIYIGRIIISAPPSRAVLGLVINNIHIPFSEVTIEQLEDLVPEQNIHLAIHQQAHPSHKFPINKSFSQLEQEINPGETFLERKNNIENKAVEETNKIQQDIQRREAEIMGLVKVPLHKLEFNVDELLDSNNIGDSRLLKYLVMNGHLDENYHDYISSFHEGRLTINDRDFLLTIRSFNQPEPNQEINTPSEVIENMRKEDFSQKYVLNVTLIDYLLETMEKEPTRIKQATDYIAQNFEQSEEFLASYFTNGRHLEEFIQELSKNHPELATLAISSSRSVELVSYILRFVDADYICENMNQEGKLSGFIAEQGKGLFALELHLPQSYNVLKKLSVRFKKLQDIEKNVELIGYSHHENLYEINPENIHYILETFPVTEDVTSQYIETANYDSIINTGSESLNEYIERNLQEYIKQVLLALPKNTKESGKSISYLVNHELVDVNLAKEIISKQEHVFESFDGLPVSLWTELLNEEKVSMSWDNIATYFSNDECDEEILTEILERESTLTILEQRSMKDEVADEDNKQNLSRFILNNNVIEDVNYFKLIKLLPYTYTNFPKEMSHEKIIALAKERVVRLNEKSFAYASGDDELLAILISKNYDTYIDNKGEYIIDDDVRELLLLSDLPVEQKLNVCADVTTVGVSGSGKLSSLMADLLVANEIDCSVISKEVLTLVISKTNASEASIKLLIKCIPNWTESETMSTLSNLRVPYNQIADYRRAPVILRRNPYNVDLAKLLKAKNFVSSVHEDKHGITINTFRSREHS